MDMSTNRESIQLRGGTWDTAGKLTSQFLVELEEYAQDGEIEEDR